MAGPTTAMLDVAADGAGAVAQISLHETDPGATGASEITDISRLSK